MKTVALLGAGFTRNWGGWLANEAFEFLLGCPEVIGNAEVRNALWEHKDKGGFETALGEIRRRCMYNPQTIQPQLNALTAAINRFFFEMNVGLLSITQFEFRQSRDPLVCTALARFDAIFTLNQDLLLEQHYLNDNVALLSNGRWNGYQLPGLSSRKGGDFERYDTPAGRIFTPLEPSSFRMADGCQPLMKLHGSSNWEERFGGPILITGNRKANDQMFHPILNWYMEEFERTLNARGTRLMVIGYGFRDQHINQLIEAAATSHGLQLFIVDPAGSDIAWRVNASRGADSRASQESSLESAFKKSVVGASRRSLREIFGDDKVEHAKVMQFLQ